MFAPRSAGRTAAPRSDSRRARPALEALEPRDVPAALFVASFFDSAIYQFDSGTGALQATPVAPYSSALLSGPAGLAVGPDDNLYISSQFNNSILKYDRGTSTLSTFITSAQLAPIAAALGAPGFAPAGLRFGPDGNLYVSLNGGQSSSTGAVVRFDTTLSGNTITYAGTSTTLAAGQIVQPSGLTFGTSGDPDSLYVSSPGTGAVVKIAAAATGSPTVSTFVAPGSGSPLPLNFASGLTWGADGKLYVVDLGAVSNLGQVLRFNANGTFDTTYVSAGNGAGAGDLAFQFPSDAVFDTQGRLFVANLGPGYPPGLAGSVYRYSAGGAFNTALVTSGQFPNTGGGASGVAPSQLGSDLPLRVTAFTPTRPGSWSTSAGCSTAPN